MLIGLLLTLSVPILFLYVIWLLEAYAVSEVKLTLLNLGWGALSFVAAYAVQSTLASSQVLTFWQITLGSAPFLEEIFKAAFLVYLAHRLLIRYAVDGTVYGFAIGTGFAIGENLLYLNNNPALALEIATGRVLSVSLMHAFTAAIVGTVAGSDVFQNLRRRAARITLALLAAILLHATYNLIAISLQGPDLIAVGIGIGLTGTMILVLLARHALRRESAAIRREIEKTLSPGEVAATVNPRQIAEIITRNRSVLGPTRAALLEEYIHLQAKRGILRKTVDLSQRRRSITPIVQELAIVEQRLDTLQDTLGLYTRSWLRTLLPSEESDTWANLTEVLKGEQPLLNLLIELNQRETQISSEEYALRKQLLAETDLFGELSEEDRGDLILLLGKLEFKTADVVLHQNASNDRIFVVAAGSLVISAIEMGGAEHILRACYRGETLGEMSMLDGLPSTASISCLEDSTIYTLTRSDFITLAYAKPQVGLIMQRKIIERLRHQTRIASHTEQALRAISARTETILNALEDAIIALDHEGRVLTWNRAAEVLLGYSESEVIDRFVTDFLLDPGQAIPGTPAWDEFSDPPARANQPLDISLRHKDASQLEVSLIIVHPEPNDLACCIWIAQPRTPTLNQTLQKTFDLANNMLNVEDVVIQVLINAQRMVPHAAANLGIIEGSMVRTRRLPCQDQARSIMRADIPLYSLPTLREMVSTGKPLLIEDTQDFPGWTALQGSEWIRSYIGIPLRARDCVFGFLNLDSPDRAAFTTQQVHKLQVYASQVAAVVDNALSYAASIHRVEELRGLTNAMGHYLRLPLTTITGHAQLLASPETAGSLNPSEQVDYLSTIANSATRTAADLEHLMLLAEVLLIQNPQMENVHVGDCLQEAMHRLSHRIKETKADFRLPQAWPTAATSPRWLVELCTQVLSVLLDKGAPSPRIDIGAAITSDGSLHCQFVSQADPAVVDQYRSLLKPFAELPVSLVTGTGGNLTLIYEICARLGGSTDIAPSSQGWSLTFRLPPGMPAV